ncbi:UNVERIFIED_CONTAM: Anthranilate synthase alpha subunit, chloroplastic [Sesamum angustifolium]|uniref:anthranilate synthase n=1 Tax=Sesamum angustifolium TaxID=2727405 RepID=A0AAW2PTE7_9LAMI
MQMQALTFSQRPFPTTRSVSSASVSGISGRDWSSSVKFRLRTFRCRALKSPSLEMDEKRFLEASQNGNLIPLYKCIFSDHLTPVLAYDAWLKDDRDAPSFLFESVEPGFRASSVGRYSVVGAQPALEVVAKRNKVTILDHDSGKIIEKLVEDPMTIPKDISEGWRPQQIQDLPDAFCGGWVGFFSYDTVRYVEKKKLTFSSAPKDDRNLADIHLGLYDDVIVFDHVDKKAYVIHWVRLDRFSSAKKAYDDGMKRLETLVSKVQDIDPPRLSPGCIDFCTRDFGLCLNKSNMTSEEYMKAVIQAKEHILAGDIFQIVLSQRFERRTFADPFEVYRALRVVNPSPYMAYLQARGCILVASSPEILTRVKKKKIVNRPLAGTARRGKTLHEDEMLEMKLLKDEKQCAEHIMLVDLGRNDVGKVSKSGSVKVEKLMTVERYSHVMHISSTVTGELRDHLTGWDALRAALPVGTVSGAPKVKAMELIDQLEPTRRGPYSGGFGGVSFSGDMDIALALRTIVFPTGVRYDTMYSYKDGNKRREWVAHIQSGAGIVADSLPDDEQTECERKAAGLARAIDLAESAFVNKASAQPAKASEIGTNSGERKASFHGHGRGVFSGKKGTIQMVLMGSLGKMSTLMKMGRATIKKMFKILVPAPAATNSFSPKFQYGFSLAWSWSWSSSSHGFPILPSPFSFFLQVSNPHSSSSPGSATTSPPPPPPLPLIYCGRGDKKTARGKRFNHSFGNARPKDKKKGRGPPRVPAPPLPPRKDKYDDGEVVKIEIDESLFSN